MQHNHHNHLDHFLKANLWSIIITVLSLIGLGLWHGPGAALTATVLIAIEMAFSFDNAVVNAKILGRLSRFWQQMFLTIGIIIAVVGMRLVFPILIVAVTAGLGFSEVVKLALYDSKEYAHYLELAHPSIAAFGGGFLLTLALYFLFDDQRKIRWFARLEKKLQAAGGHWWLAPALALVGVGLASLLPGNKHVATTLEAGTIGVVGYAAMTQLMAWLGRKEPVDKDGRKRKVQTGWAAFGGFMYLQLLDASFSFDGVLGAFAITNDVILIAVGLGVGALWVRSFTVQLVRHNTLEHLPYLEHGAHYAILALALALLASITSNIPDAVTGFVGIVIIIASLRASRLEARRGA